MNDVSLAIIPAAAQVEDFLAVNYPAALEQPTPRVTLHVWSLFAFRALVDFEGGPPIHLGRAELFGITITHNHAFKDGFAMIRVDGADRLALDFSLNMAAWRATAAIRLTPRVPDASCHAMIDVVDRDGVSVSVIPLLDLPPRHRLETIEEACEAALRQADGVAAAADTGEIGAMLSLARLGLSIRSALA